MSSMVAPVLASDLLGDTFTTMSGVEQTRQSALSLGVKDIDAMLDGGFDFGRIYCITAQQDTTSSDLINALVASHSRLSDNSSSTIIDSTVGFDVNKLFKALHLQYSDPEQAMQALDRVKIMKVFDTVGLTEAIDEVRSSMEFVEHNEKDLSPVQFVHRSTIADSQAEEDLLTRVKPQPPSTAAKTPASAVDIHPTNLVIVRDISQIFAPLIKVDYTHGQAMLHLFMRTLSELTRVHQICTVVFASASSKPASEEDCISQFQSCTLQPLLGLHLGYLMDMQLYRHGIPVKQPREEVRGGTTLYVVHSENVEVLEVVQDRHGSCLGKWATFSMIA